MGVSPKTGLIIGAALATVCVSAVFFVSSFVNRLIGTTGSSGTYDEAKEQGLPIVATDLQLPGQKYGDVKTTAVLDRFRQGGPDEATQKLFANLVSLYPDWAAAKKQLHTSRETLVAVRQIATSGKVLTKKDWDLGAELPFPELQGARYSGRALCASAIVSAHDGDFSSAARDLKLARDLSQAILSQPTMLGLLNQSSMDRSTYKATELCTQFAAGNAGHLKIIRSVFEEKPFPFREALRAEAYMQVVTLRNLNRYGGITALSKLADGSAPAPQGPIVRDGLPSDQVAKRMLYASLEFWMEAFKKLDAKPKELLEVAGEIDLLSASQKSSIAAAYVKAFTLELLPVAENCYRTEAIRRCQLALNQILEYKLAHGRFPANLAAAKISLLDPFDKQPLRYEQTIRGVHVWSIGPDRVDNGGKTKDETQTKEFDVIASYPAALSLKESS